MSRQRLTALSRILGGGATLLAVFGLTGTSSAGEPVCDSTWDIPFPQPQAPGFPITPFCATSIVYNGDLIVGGGFLAMDDVPAFFIARWDGEAWHDMAGGMDGPVLLLGLYNGDLIASGQFSSAGGVDVSNIARWDGEAWHAMGDGLDSGPGPGPMLVRNGRLVVGGNFTMSGDEVVSDVAEWDGKTWHDAGPEGLLGSVMSIGEFEGDLVIGGGFDNVEGTEVGRIARFNGKTWSAFDAGFSSGGGGGFSLVFAIQMYNGSLIAAGQFREANGVTVNSIARWDGSSWQPLGSGLTTSGGNPGAAVAVYEYEGELIVAGKFLNAGGVAVNNIAAWNGSEWRGLGDECPGGSDCGLTLENGPFSGNAYGLTEYEGKLVVAGAYVAAGGIATNGLATWECAGSSCIAADLDCSGAVDVFDLLDLLAAWGACDNPPPAECPGDIDSDGQVNVFDLLSLLASWG